MIKNCFNRWRCGVFLSVTLGMATAHGAESLGIVGKNDWLFLRSELSGPADAAGHAETISLIGRFNRVLLANGISMAVTIVPAKVRLYAEYLPDNIKLNDYQVGSYERMSKALQAAGVTVIDLNTAFLNSPMRGSETPLYYRLDSHWSFIGAKVAAEAFKAGIDANPVLKKALDATPEVAYQMIVAKRKRPSKANELIALAPPNSGPFAPEQFTQVNVNRTPQQNEANRAPIGITVQGSSSSQEWTGFVDALRFVLQRDILNVSVPVTIGSWVGMENYLSSDAFQTKPPKMLIWERAEYAMRAPPDFPYQDPRYVINNTEWLLRASAWVQAACKPSTVTARLAQVGLAANGINMKGGEVVTGPTNENEFIEITFDKPIEKLDYLVARAVTAGSKTLILEGMGPGTTTRRFKLNVPGDDAIHVLKTPLPSNGPGFSKVRVYPGKSDGFTLKDLQICRQPEDILK